MTTFVERDDTRIAALIHDASLAEEPQLVGAVTSAAGIALENERLQADLRARLSDLRASRARIVEAGDSARRKLERDLHDGAQQRLVSISIVLRVVAGKLPDGAPEAKLLERAREELNASLEELRNIARGIHPAILSDHGLPVALESLAARAPVRVTLDVELGERPPPQLEVAAYYLIAEGLTNVAKYAEAESATIAIMRENGSLVVELSDDGKGGADPRRRVRPARAGRPRRGARRAPEDLEPAGGRNTTESGDPMRVVLADDTMLLREGVAMLLGEAGFDVAGQAGTAEDLIEAVSEHRPEVAIVDLRMPPTHTDEGLQAALTIRAQHPKVGVLVLSQHADIGLAMKLLDSGAEGVGYMLKDRVSDLEDFADAIRRVAAGGSALDPTIVSQLLSKRREAGPLDDVTAREREVLELMAEGRSNQGIADRLEISERGVQKHVTSIFEKLGIPAGTDDHRRVLAVLTFLRA